jgi:hypothetical protein
MDEEKADSPKTTEPAKVPRPAARSAPKPYEQFTRGSPRGNAGPKNKPPRRK